jgi:hypothetical protein
MTVRRLLIGTAFPSPMGRGWREAPGEGVRPLSMAMVYPANRHYPLTLSLSPWERALEAPAIAPSARSSSARRREPSTPQRCGSITDVTEYRIPACARMTLSTRRGERT